MTLFNPVWKVTIAGIEYTSAVLANLTITSGRTNIYEQAAAGYVNLEIINLDKSSVPITINDSLTIQLKNSDRKSTRLNSSHIPLSRMPSSA